MVLLGYFNGETNSFDLHPLQSVGDFVHSLASGAMVAPDHARQPIRIVAYLDKLPGDQGDELREGKAIPGDNDLAFLGDVDRQENGLLIVGPFQSGQVDAFMIDSGDLGDRHEEDNQQEHDVDHGRHIDFARRLSPLLG
jgi:hypothetical protein